ncbi:MAG TPA: hypothetical protein DCY88_11000 [Cyanobacteria bacterium UBA11372]|nr:hypothetical protein [Cyanobacteria bacterium UBA11372]
MKKIGNIDPFASGRPHLSDEEREKLRQAKYQQQKEDGYQKLVELCRIGEYEAARHLANRNPHWGYQVIDGEIIELNDLH